MAEGIVMYSPVFPAGSVPGLCQVKNPLSPLIQRGGDVLQQPWPTVDPEYLEAPEFVELFVMVGSHSDALIHTVFCLIYILVHADFSFLSFFVCV